MSILTDIFNKFGLMDHFVLLHADLNLETAEAYLFSAVTFLVDF